MTKDEAKTKWCPHVRVGVISEVTGAAYAANRAGSEGKMIGAAMCIGSACMAWRWEVPPMTCRPPNEPSGYCGLAGRP